MEPKPFSDRELEEIRQRKGKGYGLTFQRLLNIIAADRLNLDLHIANRALEINIPTMDLRKRIAEIEAENRRLRDGLEKIVKGKPRLYTPDEGGETCVCLECEGFIMIAEQVLHPQKGK